MSSKEQVLDSLQKYKTKIVLLISAAAFVAALALSGGISHATPGTTFVVDDDGMATAGNCNSVTPTPYTTITAAVTAAAAGDTVKVCPGTYPENVDVNKTLTVKGAKAGSDVDGRTFGSANESTVTGTVADTSTITVSAAGVTFDGFSITNPNHGLGVTVKTAGNSALVKNNIVDGVGGVGYLNHTVGVYLENGPDDVTVKDNRINNLKSDNPVSPGTAQGILVGDSLSNNPSLGIVLDDNTITNINSTAKGAYGIQLNNGANSSATGYTTAKVTGNTIKNLSGNWAHGVGLEGDTPNVVVKFNTVSNLVDVNPTPIADVAAVLFEDNVFFFTADVNRNSLDVGANGFGIAVNPALTTLYPTLTADGTCNWWGAKNGPSSVGTGSGSHVTSGVDFSPWLKSSNLKKGCNDGYNDHHYGHGHDDKDRHHDDWDD